MSKEQWLLYKRFCEFAKFQDNSDAKIPNAIPGLEVYIEGTGISGWDPLDDPTAMASPEFLVFILQRAKLFYEKERDENEKIFS